MSSERDLARVSARGREKTPDSVAEKILDLWKKAAIMQSLDASGGIDRSRLRIVAFYTQAIFSQFVSGHHVEGLENLREARKWVDEEGKRIILTPRHEADFDTCAARYILDHEDLTDFANNTTWIAGVNMLRRIYIRPFMRGENVIYITTPADLAGIKALLASCALDAQQQEVAKGILSIFNDTNDRATSKTREAAKKGRNLVVYPEAGRSYDGLMRKAPSEVSVYFPRHGEAVVVPYRQYGPKEINPPNKFVRLRKLIPGFRQHLGMRIGVPYLSSEIWEVWREIKKEPAANPMDWVMANLANVDPSDVRPEELARYKGLMERFKPERISKALAMAA